MITGEQLAIAIAAVLLVAVALGWVLHWLWLKLSKAPVSAKDRMTEMASRMHDADRGRERADHALGRAERILAERETELQTEIITVRTELETAMAEREADLSAALREAQVDSEAYMEGLRNARERITELEAEVRELQESVRS